MDERSPALPGERGVSKVVGNVLLVAVAVILASIIGPFAYSVAQDASGTAPASVFEFEQTQAGGVTITYEQGRPLDTERLSLAGSDPDGNVTFGDWPSNGTLSAGDTVEVPDATGNETIIIRWETSEGRTLPLAEHEF